MSRKIRSISEETFQELCDEVGGICLECGHVQYGVEPDAENYKCESCGERAVAGSEQALILGLIEIQS